jgi:hypothetical protein
VQFFVSLISASAHAPGEPLLQAVPAALSYNALKQSCQSPAVRIPGVKVQAYREPKNPDADTIQPKPYFCIELLFL